MFLLALRVLSSCIALCFLLTLLFILLALPVLYYSLLLALSGCFVLLPGAAFPLRAFSSRAVGCFILVLRDFFLTLHVFLLGLFFF